MKSIKESDFNPSMGILIDVKDPISYGEKHNPYSICSEGHKSKQAVRILSFYGYDVTYVINS